MTTRLKLPSSLPARPLAALLGAALLAVTAGWLSAQQPAKPAVSAPQPAATAAAAPAPKPTPSKDEPTSSLIQGDLIYTHLGEADPFWPKPQNQCKKGDPSCEVARDAKGCKKYKLEEMILTGVTDTNGLKVAMLSAENKPYFVKTGDQCYDAQVLDIDEKTTKRI